MFYAYISCNLHNLNSGRVELSWVDWYFGLDICNHQDPKFDNMFDPIACLNYSPRQSISQPGSRYQNNHKIYKKKREEKKWHNCFHSCITLNKASKHYHTTYRNWENSIHHPYKTTWLAKWQWIIWALSKRSANPNSKALHVMKLK